jgi:hypothetical protein
VDEVLAREDLQDVLERDALTGAFAGEGARLGWSTCGEVAQDPVVNSSLRIA